jgi:hypothetical protein
MDPFRGGGSPTLSALAADASDRVPRQSQLLTAEQRRERLELAAGVHDQRGGGGFAIGAGLAGIVSIATCGAATGARSDLGGGATAFFLASLVVTAGLLVAADRESTRARRARDAAIAKLLAWPATLPFPVDGYDEFLVADTPLVDVTLATPPGRKLFADAARAVDAAIQVDPIGERTFRLTVPVRSRTFTSKHSARLVRYGDRELLARLFEVMILPVHAELGVERVELGGTIELRN